MKVWKYAIIQLCKHAIKHIYKYASMQVTDIYKVHVKWQGGGGGET